MFARSQTCPYQAACLIYKFIGHSFLLSKGCDLLQCTHSSLLVPIKADQGLPCVHRAKTVISLLHATIATPDQALNLQRGSHNHARCSVFDLASILSNPFIADGPLVAAVNGCHSLAERIRRICIAAATQAG